MDTMSIDQLRLAPKVLLHDHLDGGLRPATVVELAETVGHNLPTTDPEELAEWFHRGANRRDLVLYLEPFAHTVAVLQSADALRRVARECVEDLASDGVVYAEVRFAPELHLQGELTLDDVVEAVLEGFRDATRTARTPAGDPIAVGLLCTAMRTAARGDEIAELAIRHRDGGVVGFDIAGAEAGFPPTRHLSAFELVHRENGHVTIHAGEGFHQSGRRSSCAAPRDSATAFASWTTSLNKLTTRMSSEGSRRSCVIAACPLRCALPRTFTSARHQA